MPRWSSSRRPPTACSARRWPGPAHCWSSPPGRGARRALDATDFFVVVPYYNEAAGIAATLDALYAQSDTGFTLVCVDNGSSDAGAVVVRAWAARHPDLRVVMLEERQKGT